jgi:molybdenum cofactor biosynthesis enzyme MoaA
MNNKFECYHPFVGFDIDVEGVYQICCQSNVMQNDKIWEKSPLEFFNSDLMNDIRSKFLLDNPENDPLIKKYCRDCLYKEKNSGDSKRIRDLQHMSNSLRKNYNKNKELFINGVRELEYGDTHFKFESFGNICNLKCIICVPSRSSAWAVETFKFKGISIVHNTHYASKINEHNQIDEKTGIYDPIQNLGEKKKYEFFDDLYEIVSNCEILDVSGGEPSLSKTFIEMLDYFITKGGFKNNLIVHINSNCTAKTSFFEKILKNYKLKVSVSLDSFGEKNEYIRSGLQWKTVQKNMFEYSLLARKNKNFSLHVCVTPQALNAGSVTELIDWLRRESLARIDINQILTIPSALSFTSIPNELRNEYLKRMEKYDNLDIFKESLKNINFVENDFLTMIYGLDQLDKIRYGERKWSKLWPELLDYYEKII